MGLKPGITLIRKIFQDIKTGQRKIHSIIDNFENPRYERQPYTYPWRLTQYLKMENFYSVAHNLACFKNGANRAFEKFCLGSLNLVATLNQKLCHFIFKQRKQIDRNKLTYSL